MGGSDKSRFLYEGEREASYRLSPRVRMDSWGDGHSLLSDQARISNRPSHCFGCFLKGTDGYKMKSSGVLTRPICFAV